MKGKIFTILGIVAIFGFFISESFKNSYDSTKIVLSGTDTLGQDWGAIADQKLMEANAQGNPNGNNTDVVTDIYYGAQPTLLNEKDDPYSRDKINPSNYSTIQDNSGREVITGYTRQEQLDQNENYKTRHQLERNSSEEPSIIYRE